MKNILTLLFLTLLIAACSSPITGSLQTEGGAKAASALPDLVPTSLVVDSQNWYGISFHFNLKNAGKAPFDSQYLDLNYVLSDQQNGRAIFSGTTETNRFFDPLAAGASTTYGSTALPGSPLRSPYVTPAPNPVRNILTSDSSKYLSVEITPEFSAPESNYANNKVSVLLPEKLPDLTTYISVSKNTSTVLTYNYEIRNIGLKPIPKSSIYLRLWIASDYAGTNRLSGNFESHYLPGTDDLQPGHALSFDHTHTFPVGTLASNRYTVAQVTTSLPESDSTNNLTTWQVGFHPQPTPNPDPLFPQK